jgi:hypothetical protein
MITAEAARISISIGFTTRATFASGSAGSRANAFGMNSAPNRKVRTLFEEEGSASLTKRNNGIKRWISL